MTVTVPTAIRALNCGSDELTRNTTGYLSLAAIHNGRLLAQYSLQIIANILNGSFKRFIFVAERNDWINEMKWKIFEQISMSEIGEL